jgi:glycolate oxidase FAD binding subunit
VTAPGTTASYVIVLYDGVCGLCNRLVQFLLRRDRSNQFRFASLQSQFAREALVRHGIDSADLNTVYLIVAYRSAHERLLQKSEAIAELAASVGGVWKLGDMLRVLPRSLADALYDFVARRRYQIFGKYKTCPLPGPGDREKFLDTDEAAPQTAVAVELGPELARICGEEHVHKDPSILQACAIGGVVPRVVVEPASADEIAVILRFATANRLAVVPAGCFTRQHISALPRRVDVVLHTNRLNAIENGSDETIHVGVGTGIGELRTRLAQQNQLFPIEREGTVGGALAVAAEGPLRHGYGSLRQCCTAMIFVTGEGAICRLPDAVPDKLRGLDLTGLMIGSYGDLGVIVNASLKVFPRPAQTRTFVAKFLLASGAIQFRDRVLRSSLRPMCLELVSPRASEFLDRPEQTWNLYIRLAGDGGLFDGYRADLGGETYVKEELEGDLEKRVWRAISALEDTVVARHANAMIVRVRIPVDDTGQAIQAAEKLAVANNFLCAQIGRVGIGSLVMAFIPLGAPITTNYSSAVAALRAPLPAESASIVARCPAEVKPLVELWKLPQADLEQLRAAKRIMDPAGVLNPGRFVMR